MKLSKKNRYVMVGEKQKSTKQTILLHEFEGKKESQITGEERNCELTPTLVI